MQPRIIIKLTLLLFTFWLTGISLQAQEPNPDEFVFRILSGKCPNSEDTTLTGFRVQDQTGIVTALHGVVNCNIINAVSNAENSNVHKNLQILQADVERDVAILGYPNMPVELSDNRGFQVITESLSIQPLPDEGRDVITVGYPYGIQELLTNQFLRVRVNQLARLGDLLGSNELASNLSERKSPNPDINVLSLEGNLEPGLSGSPILLDNKVIAVGNGGLKQGASSIGWAIPWSDILLRDWSYSNDANFESPYEGYSYSRELPENLLALTVKILNDQEVVEFSKTIPTIEDETYRYLLSDDIVDIPSQATVAIFDGDVELAAGSFNSPIFSQAGLFQVDNRNNVLILQAGPQQPLQCPITIDLFARDSNESVDNADIKVIRFGNLVETETLLPINADNSGRGAYNFNLPQPCSRYSTAIVRIEADNYQPSDRTLNLRKKQNFESILDPVTCEKHGGYRVKRGDTFSEIARDFTRRDDCVNDFYKLHQEKSKESLVIDSIPDKNSLLRNTCIYRPKDEDLKPLPCMHYSPTPTATITPTITITPIPPTSTTTPSSLCPPDMVLVERSSTSFCLDIYEVRNDHYQACVDNGNCIRQDEAPPWPDYWQQTNYPVVQVSWQDADIFCTYRGVRLPTDDEWKLAYRAVGEVKYPILQKDDDPVAVNAEELTISTDGVFGLAGNVWEFTALDEQQQTHLRGGFSPKTETGLKVYDRHWGFRCAADLELSN